MEDDRLLSDLKKEKMAIEAGIYNAEHLSELVSLQPEDFYSEYHQKIMQAIHNIYNSPEQVGLVTIRDELMKLSTNGLYKKFETEFLGFETIGQEITYTIESLKDLSNKRKLWKVCSDKAHDIQNPVVSCEDVCIELQDTMSEVLRKDIDNDWEGSDIKTKYIPTYLDNLNDIIIGLFQGDLITLAAVTSQGKTTLALNIAQKICLDRPVLFFSMEMPFFQLKQRILSTDLCIPLDRLRRNELTYDEQETITDYQKKMSVKYKNLHIYPERYLHNIKNITKSLTIKLGGLGLVVVDYIQQVRIKQKIDSRRLQVDEVTMSLKELAMECEVPVLEISQFSRLQKGTRPELYHLKESGGIENDSDMVWFIHDKNIIVAKNRQGKKGEAAIRHDAETYRFLDRFV